MSSVGGIDPRGVSSTVGTVLLVAIAIVLVVAVATFTLSLTDTPSEPAQAGIDINDGSHIELVVDGNADEIILRDEDGNVHGTLEDVGDRIDFDGLDLRTEYSLIGVRGDEETLLGTVSSDQLVGEISTPTSIPASYEPEDELEGSGEEDDPYVVRNDSDLQAIGNAEENDYAYVLGNDIDASLTGDWDDGGFEPIDDFEGTLDGDGHTIYGLTIDQETEDVGLFSRTKEDATIEDVAVADMDIAGGENVGALVGSNEGTISGATAGYEMADVYEDGVHGTENVGGLVGTNEGTVEDSSTTGTISGDSSEIAGLVGQNYEDGEIDSSYSTAGVSIDDLSDRHVAGLVGTNEGNVTNSHATGDIEVDGVGDDYPRVGGLVGENYGTITESYATGDVTGEENNYGGLVGINWGGTVERSYATGDVDTDGRAGALVARESQSGGSADEDIQSEEGHIVDSYATGDVSSTDDDAAGGIIGSVHSASGTNVSIENTYATGTITGGDTGGLIGENNGDATIENSYWDNETTGQTDAVGDGSFENEGNVTGLETAEMTGTDAEDNMDGFDFEEVWAVVLDDYPELLALE